MTVLVTGATGFVGRHLIPALRDAGHALRCASRDPDAARERRPGLSWVRLDVSDPDTLASALEGCRAAYYLIHGMTGGDDAYPEHEAAAAAAFARAAEDARVERVVYLGGVAPAGVTSRHLQSRARVGAILRSADIGAVELRAAMIIGPGGVSWQVVRDLAARLPAMIQPRWLGNHSWPVALEDVIAALVAALDRDRVPDGIHELPGPERIAHRELLARTRRALGHFAPIRVSVPLLTPWLSSLWIGLVSRVDWSVTRELVEGLRTDLDPSGPSLWERIDHRPLDLDAAIRTALLAAGESRAKKVGQGARV